MPEHSDKTNGVSQKKPSFQTLSFFLPFCLHSHWSLRDENHSFVLSEETGLSALRIPPSWHSFPLVSMMPLSHGSPFPDLFGAWFSVYFAESSSFSWSFLAAAAASVMSDSVRPQGQQPTRLLCPRNSLGKSTGVGCHFLLHNSNQNQNHYNCDLRAYCMPVPSPLLAGPSLFRTRDQFHGDNFPMVEGSGWFRDDSSILHLLCTLFQLFLHQLYLRSSGIRSQRLGMPTLNACAPLALTSIP